MIDTRYWRTAAYLGLIAAILLGVMFTITGIEESSPDSPDMPEVDYESSHDMMQAATGFLLWTVAFFPLLLFFLAAKEVTIAPERLLLRRFVDIMATLMYILILMPGFFSTTFPSLIQNNAFADIFFSVAYLFAGFIMMSFGFAMRNKTMWPRWLIRLTFFCAVWNIINYASLYWLLSEAGMRGLSVMVTPAWMVIFSAFLINLEIRVKITSTEHSTPIIKTGGNQS